MRLESSLKLGMAIVVMGGLLALTGCGGKQEVKPEATPVVAATPEPTPEIQKYGVIKGDTLWGISGLSNIYSDNFQWPLIFKANRDQIQDPDLIEVGQDFVISREFGQADVDQAISNAKRTPRYKVHHKARKTLPIQY